jgi:vacuolar iron transporter family protein
MNRLIFCYDEYMAEKQSKKIHHEHHMKSRSNWLRAAVLGSNDGIVSIAGLVVGVAGATASKGIILTAGIAGILAGALSMAAGEYVSVSTQRDIEKKALKEKEGNENRDHHHYLTNPWHAAFASAAAFFIGSIIPLVAIMLPLGALSIPTTFLAVIIALLFTGYMSARLGRTNAIKAVIRVTSGGILAMAITYSIGTLFGVSV